MRGLVLVELGEQGVQGAQVLGGRRVGAEVEHERQREAEEQVGVGAAGEARGGVAGEAEELGAGELEGVEPVHAALVACLQISSCSKPTGKEGTHDFRR